jgi:hypothetical protein
MASNILSWNILHGSNLKSYIETTLSVSVDKSNCHYDAQILSAVQLAHSKGNNSS